MEAPPADKLIVFPERADCAEWARPRNLEARYRTGEGRAHARVQPAAASRVPPLLAQQSRVEDWPLRLCHPEPSTSPGAMRIFSY
jgi:hypothetical protein